MTITDDFWAPRREQVRTSTLRQQERQLRAPGQQFDALRLTWQPGDPHEPHIFWESDVAKWIEAASYCLATTADPELEASVDEAISLLAGAQQPDGYLNVYFTVVKPGQRFTDLRDAHELYCAGHLIEAAVAHHAATGKTTLLDVMTRYADLIDREFGPGGSCEGGYDGHEEIELALVKLARATGERRYLDCALRMVTARGQRPFYYEAEEARRGDTGYFGGVFPQRPRQAEFWREYNQSHLPVVEQSDAVGHSVRAMYLYAAVTDLAVETGDEALAAACDRVWESLTQRRLYVTGGVGARHDIEGFGGDYELPDARGYAETCAAIGLVFWAQRMANARRDAAYVEVLERALYNGVLSGASADGTSYFYGNPLASDGSVHRHEWFGVACCPPNLARLLSSLELYAYAQGAEEAVVNLYISGSARFDLADGPLALRVRSEHPVDGSAELRVTEAAPGPVTLSLRIPAWATGAQLVVAGRELELSEVVADGYARVRREWAEGDVVQLRLGMDPQRVWAHPAVFDTAHRVALQRGPLVFCLEGVDHQDAVAQLSLPRGAVLDVQDDATSGTVALLAGGSAVTGAADRSAPLYGTEPPATRAADLRAVPYFSWANRGQSDMTVWIHEMDQA
ncbi:glycoside hydrolase family 127 protein [Quadrisphaera setariae]|uniref:glycoside hydrolase family 127 protein n=1 Tax=Quadrisphaera setariae TaxID=2593304 RepID=UPI001C9C8731|nr:beta-L-arabinofuranosidase domain-containing protein [Quadrisphaera setariae]